MTLKDTDKKYVMNTYNRFDLEIVKGKGSIVYDEKGKEYIDLTSGIGVTSFGLCDELWQKAIEEQASQLQHMSNLFYTSPCALLAKKLCEKTSLSKVFFANSGAEANECAIKVARKYSIDKKGNDYFNIITLNDSFHGRTLTTLSATGQDKFHELFNPLTPGFIYSKPNDIDYLKEIVDKEKVAGIMMECIQGEGGVNVLDKNFLKEVETLCKENDIPLIIDEVQTGNGRTGKLYSYMNYNISPDIITTAKGLGGGLPIGACLVNEKLENVLGFGDHGSTFGGNPVCCAGAISIIDRLTDNFLNDVIEKGNYIISQLSNEPDVENITGLGLMIGIKTNKETKDVIQKCIEKGVLVLSAKDKIRLLPALNIDSETLKIAIEKLKEAIIEA